MGKQEVSRSIKSEISNKFFILFVVAIAFLFCEGGCGSSNGNNSSAPSSTDTKVQEGQLLDAKVEGMYYETQSNDEVQLTGKTDASGKFKYHDGEKIIFKLGETKFGETKATKVITPYGLSTSIEGGDNRAKMLMSLDKENQNENVIVIDEKKTNKMIESVDFDNNEKFQRDRLRIEESLGVSIASDEKVKEHTKKAKAWNVIKNNSPEIYKAITNDRDYSYNKGHPLIPPISDKLVDGMKRDVEKRMKYAIWHHLVRKRIEDLIAKQARELDINQQGYEGLKNTAEYAQAILTLYTFSKGSKKVINDDLSGTEEILKSLASVTDNAELITKTIIGSYDVLKAKVSKMVTGKSGINAAMVLAQGGVDLYTGGIAATGIVHLNKNIDSFDALECAQIYLDEYYKYGENIYLMSEKSDLISAKAKEDFDDASIKKEKSLMVSILKKITDEPYWKRAKLASQAKNLVDDLRNEVKGMARSHLSALDTSYKKLEEKFSQKNKETEQFDWPDGEILGLDSFESSSQKIRITASPEQIEGDWGGLVCNISSNNYISDDCVLNGDAKYYPSEETSYVIHVFNDANTNNHYDPDETIYCSFHELESDEISAKIPCVSPGDKEIDIPNISKQTVEVVSPKGDINNYNPTLKWKAISNPYLGGDVFYEVWIHSYKTNYEELIGPYDAEYLDCRNGSDVCKFQISDSLSDEKYYFSIFASFQFGNRYFEKIKHSESLTFQIN